MTCIGLQIGPHRVRAVVLAGWPRPRVQVADVPFGVAQLAEAVDALRPHIGRARRAAIALDLQLIRTKRITLPMVPAAERRHIVRLEPDRFFAIRGTEIVPAVRASDDLVFAATTPALTDWIAAVEQIAPVDVVEPTPAALARAFARADMRDAAVLFDGRAAGMGVAEIRDGAVTRARRMFGALPQVVEALIADELPRIGATVAYLDPWDQERAAALAGILPGGSIAPLPALRFGGRTGSVEVPGAFAAPYGAALALTDPPAAAGTLMPDVFQTKARRRGMRQLGMALTTCTAGFLFALSALNDRQDRAVRDLDAAIASLTARSAPAVAMEAELSTLERQTEAVRTVDADRRDPLRVLRALSTGLPVGAFVRQIRVIGPDWQVDGYAPNASAVLTSLGTSADFRDVHFLSAMSRAQIGNQPYESFSLGFRFAGTP